MGATNLPQELDEAVRRRFTRRVYVPLPDQGARKTLVGHLMQKIPSCSVTDRQLTQIAKATQGYSGSDLASVAKVRCIDCHCD